MSTNPGILASASVALTRIALCFWVGGAILYVITSVAEQRYAQFDSLVRDQLATIRFPLYYRFGWFCLGTTLVTSLLAIVTNAANLRKRMLAVLGLTLISTGIAIVDYQMVYKPLQRLITPPGKTRTQEFVALHDRSRIINEVHLTIALFAAVIACLPEKQMANASRQSCPE